MTSSVDDLNAAILDVYRSTREEFDRRSIDPAFAKYVVPPATAPRPGFAIFYNPPTFRPPLLIVGLNPANFAASDSLKVFPNEEMLCGRPPTVNSYLDHQHLFAKALQAGFVGHRELLEAAIGMNLWFFQSSERAKSAPSELRAFCSRKTKQLIKLLEPQAILCLSSDAFVSLTQGATWSHVSDAIEARFADVSGTRIWYSYHPTASRHEIKKVGVADLPVVVADIAVTLTSKKLVSDR